MTESDYAIDVSKLVPPADHCGHHFGRVIITVGAIPSGRMVCNDCADTLPIKVTVDSDGVNFTATAHVPVVE